MLKDGFAGCTPAVRHCRGRQRFPVGADSISARGGSRRRALSSGRGPGMPGPYRVAIVPGGMTFLRAMRRAACPQAAADVCHSGKVRGSPLLGAASPTPRGGVRAPRPTYKPQKGRQRFPVAVILRFFCASHKKIPHRPEQRTMGAKRNKQTAKKAQSKTPKRRRSLLLAGTAPERQTAG